MPRIGDTYQRPAGIDAVQDGTIFSTKYNQNVGDVEADLNYPRPIVAGGTGASSAAVARDQTHLQVERATQTVTNFDTHPWEPGSFTAAASATAPPGALAHRFAGIVYGPDANNLVIEARDLDDTTTPGLVWVREKAAGVWGAWTSELTGFSTQFVSKLPAGDTMQGDLTISKANPFLALNKAASGQAALISGRMGNNQRWAIELGSTDAEDGVPTSFAGSSFALHRYRNDGAYGGQVLSFNRATGAAVFSGNMTVGGNTTLGGVTQMSANLTIAYPSASFTLNDTGTGGAATLYFQTRGATAWQWNVAGDFDNGALQLIRYNPLNTFVGNALRIDRTNGAVTVYGPGTMTINSDVTVVKASPVINFGMTAGSQIAGFASYTGANKRWEMFLGNSQAESGGNGGSDFAINRYTDAGALIGGVNLLNLNRATGLMTLTGDLTISKPGPYINLNNTAGEPSIYAMRNSVGRWRIIPGDGNPDTGGDAGSGFNILAYNDAGAAKFNALYMYRAATVGITLSPTSMVALGRGISGRQGNNGPPTGYDYNFDFVGGQVHGYIQATDMGYITFTSDYRVKDNVVDLDSKWDVIKALRPVSFVYKEWTPPWEVERQQQKTTEEGSPVKGKAVEPFFAADHREQWGFIAHEMQDATVMSAATGYKDVENLIQSPNPWTIIAALTKVVQELQARVEALEAA